MKQLLVAPLSVLAVAAASLAGSRAASAAAGAEARVVSPSPPPVSLARDVFGKGCLWRSKDDGSDRVGFHFSKNDPSKVKAGSGRIRSEKFIN